MKLTKRERVLLIGTLSIIAVALFLNFIYLPLNKEIAALQIQSDEINMQIQDAEIKRSKIIKLEEEISIVKEELEKKHDNILELWDQPELLVFIEETIDPLCEKKSVDFFDVVASDVLQTGDIGIRITVNNKNLQTIWEKFEKAKYFNSITSFNITKADGNSYEIVDIENNDLETKDNQIEFEVSMNIRFYTQNLSKAYPEKYDFTDGKYGRKDIFQ